MAADPLHVGAVYVEEDGGSDLHGDTFYLTFEGGAPDATPTVEPLDLDALIDPDGWDETEEGDDTDNGPTPFRRAV